MKLKYTYVDALTRIPCSDAPMMNGPAMPDVQGLEFGFGDESNWPTAVPVFCGSAPDDADPSTSGVIAVLTDEEFEQAKADEMNRRRSSVVVSMRQARLALLNAGLLDQVNTTIDAIQDPAEKEAASIAWEYAAEIRRLDPWVVRLGSALGLDDGALDALFTSALGL